MIRRDRYKENRENGLRVSISGTIGAGKSTLVENLGNHYLDSLVFKEIVDRELLELFYTSVKNGEKGRIELLNQFNFLSETIKRDIKSYFYKAPIKFYDRQISEHIHIFAKKNLSYEQFFEYDFFQERFLDALGHEGYDLSILLVVSEEENINRINKRNRSSEQITDDTYFREINAMYSSPEFMAEFERYSDKLIVIDTSNMNAHEVLLEVERHITEYLETHDYKCEVSDYE